VKDTADLLRHVGLTQIEPTVATTGSDPVLPTPFRLGHAGAAMLGAVGLAVAEVWKRRGGRPQSVGIDLREAAFALRTSMQLVADGQPPRDVWQPLSGFYQAGDGRWIQLHCNFPHHAAGTCKLLGVEQNREQVKAAIAKLKAEELETAMAAAKMCGSMVRSRAEWRAHPQGQAVAALPPITVERIADGPKQPLGRAPRPLAGIRSLDLTRVIAGPTCGRTLTEHGAEVLLVTSPNLPSIAPLVIDTGFGKRSTAIDLDTAEGRDTLQRLAAGADVFVQGYRPGGLAARGFSPEALAAIRPGIIAVSLCAYSHAGPWAGKRGYDTLVQCASGIVDEQTRSDTSDKPKHTPASALDYLTGYLAALGILAALLRRAEEGGSWHVRVSLAQTAHWLDGLGRCTPATAVPNCDDLMMETPSAFGRLRHLRPPLRLAETPPHWANPPVPLGTHPAQWLDAVSLGSAAN
jgi:crotonobetainyl-CoA:carnitine CoA-transferase CaiB-like acyl-CoA transferase